MRDIFLFCCFSSLRYSDASSLKWNDVKEDHIEDLCRIAGIDQEERITTYRGNERIVSK